MSLYEKIGRLLKQNKVYEKYNSNCTDDSNIDSLLSDLLLTNKIDSQSLLSSTILFNNKRGIYIPLSALFCSFNFKSSNAFSMISSSIIESQQGHLSFEPLWISTNLPQFGQLIEI